MKDKRPNDDLQHRHKNQNDDQSDAQLEDVLRDMKINISEDFKEKSFQATLDGVQGARKKMKRKKWTNRIMGVTGSAVVLAAAVILVVQLVGPGENGLMNNANGDNNAEVTDQDEVVQEPNVAQVMEEYKSIFLGVAESADEDGKVKELDSKNELIAHFTSIMSEDLANWFADTYFQEEDGELFIRAMDGPTWLEQDQAYDVEKISEKEYEVIQERENELIGHVNMIYVLAYSETEENWIVQDIQSEDLDDSSDPDESNDEPNEEVNRDETKDITFSIEGMEETEQFQLVNQEDLPFTTYIPANWAAESIEDLGLEGVRLAPSEYDYGKMEIVVFPEGTTEEVAEQTFRHKMDEIMTNEEVIHELPSWMLYSYYEVDGSTITGINFGADEGRFFYIVNQYVGEAGDGWGPREHVIYDEWRWKSNNQPLVD